MSAREFLRQLAKSEKVRFQDISATLDEVEGEHRTYQNFSQKINNGTIRFEEIEKIADAYNYKIVLQKRGK